MPKVRIKTGDTVLVISGKDKGKKGKVTQVLPEFNRVVVEGVNAMTKNVRSRSSKDKGQRIEYNGPIHASNVMVIDGKTDKPTRIGSLAVDGKRVRRSVRSKEALA